MRAIVGLGLCLAMVVGCSSSPVVEDGSTTLVTFDEAAVSPANMDSPLAGGTRPIGRIEGDDDSDGHPNLTPLEFELCCEAAGCIFGEDRSGKPACGCPSTAFGSLASVRVLACTVLEGCD